MFLFKKIVGSLCMPLSLCLAALFVGLLLLWFTKRQRTGKVFITLGTLALALAGCFQLASLILQPLERAYPAIKDEAAMARIQAAGTPVKWIVVLGGGHRANPGLPITSQISEASLVRLVEGIRLHRFLPESKLVLSEGGREGFLSGAEIFAEVAVALGVIREDIVVETQSRDTKDQARLIESIVGQDRFLLVTSAAHMSRAMALFQKRGVQAIPAPTNHLVRGKPEFRPLSLVPGSAGIGAAECLTREYLGLLWAKIRGQA